MTRNTFSSPEIVRYYKNNIMEGPFSVKQNDVLPLIFFSRFFTQSYIVDNIIISKNQVRKLLQQFTCK